MTGRAHRLRLASTSSPRQARYGRGRSKLTYDKTSPRDKTASAIYHRVTDDPIPTFGEAPVPKGQSLYSIGVGAPVGTHHEGTCQYSEGAVTNQRAYFQVPLGRLWKNYPVPVLYADPQWRYVEAGKMIGSYDAPVNGKEMWQHMTASWAICREGVQCPEPQLSDGPQEKKDPCGSPSIQPRLFEHCQKQKELMVEEYLQRVQGVPGRDERGS